MSDFVQIMSDIVLGISHVVKNGMPCKDFITFAEVTKTNLKTMKTKVLLTILLGAAMTCAQNLQAQNKAEIVINADLGKTTISRHIYGQFTEHLGHCIYGGLYVGEDSKIPNTNGVRNDIIDALKQIRVPNMRWPGGCFADEYHWRDGIGPKKDRPKMVNTNWGGVVEDNSFGTNEFLNLCELLGAEPYICGNVGSGTVEEMSKWIEYMTFDGESPMTKLRKENGRDKPWKVKFFGVGNENWGCGGNMTPEGYADRYRQYQTFCRNYSGNQLRKIAGGPNVDDYNWMDVLMRQTHNGMRWGVSLHHYSYPNGWDKKGPSRDFSEGDYIRTLDRACFMDELITKHSSIMDKYDPDKHTALVVDEWGAWYQCEPGTNPGFLYQQNTMRDAILAGLTLNVFHKHADRMRMANIAQMVNVLQALFLTKDEKMIKTPTYHIFDMYKVHQDATLLPTDLKCGKYTYNYMNLDQVSVSASKDKDNVVHVSLVNVDPKNDIAVTCHIRGMNSPKATGGQIVSSAKITDYNSFENPDVVKLENFNGYKMKNEELTVNLPAKSVVTIALK